MAGSRAAAVAAQAGVCGLASRIEAHVLSPLLHARPRCSAGGRDDTEPRASTLSVGVVPELPSCPTPPAPLAEIVEKRVPGAASALEGQRVIDRDIVTAYFRGAGGIGGLFVPRPEPNADLRILEGLGVVTTDTTSDSVSDDVQVAGTVGDQFGDDRGTAWTDDAVTRLDRTLRRMTGVVQGGVPRPCPGIWGLGGEWKFLPINTLDGQGARCVARVVTASSHRR